MESGRRSRSRSKPRPRGSVGEDPLVLHGPVDHAKKLRDDPKLSDELASEIFSAGASSSGSTGPAETGSAIVLGGQGLCRTDKKNLRSQLRTEAHRSGLPPPRVTYRGDALPPACNIVGRPWGSEPAMGQCHCTEIHQWLSVHNDSGRVKQVNSTTDCEGTKVQLGANGEARVCYWRCGGRNMTENAWYNGVVVKIITVDDGPHLVLIN
jgi:hypothetical protein